MTDALPASLVAPLLDHAVISVSGADAAVFLHGQLTNDVTGVGPEGARLAGYCTAKGRLLATMVLWHAVPADASAPPTVMLLVRRDLAEALIKRLRMFVLRAKVTITLSDVPVLGVQVAGEAARQALATSLGKAPGLLPWQKAEFDEGTWITAPSAHQQLARGWWIGKQGGVSDSLLARLSLPAGTEAQWRAADLQAGLPWIGAQTQDLFIPQTVNLDLIDGISFGKGCYPGQEVVARSHYRGTVKRRMAYGVVEGREAAPGTDIYEAGQAGEPCGRVIDAAGTAVLIETPLDTMANGALRLGAVDGPVIAIKELPYPVVKTA